MAVAPAPEVKEPTRKDNLTAKTLRGKNSANELNM